MRVGWVALVGLLLGCPHRGRLEEDPVARVVQEADVAWASRGEGGLAPVRDALERAEDLQDPRVAWRLARWEIARGLTVDDPHTARRHFSRARALGLACLDQIPGNREARRAGAWEDVLARTPEARVPCATWGALGWARWRLAIGDAGALDDRDLAALVGALPLDPDGIALWARGLASAATGDAEAWVWLGRAAAADPDDLVRRADRLTIGGRDDPDAWAWLLDQVPDTPEERAVLARIREMVPPGGPPRTVPGTSVPAGD